MSNQEQGVPAISYVCPDLVVVNEWGEDGRPLLDDSDDENMHGIFQDVLINVQQFYDLGVGTLFLTTRRVIWKSNDQQAVAVGYQIAFNQITMHAVCKDTDSYPQPCIYCQLEGECGEQDTFHGAASGLHEIYGNGVSQIQSSEGGIQNQQNGQGEIESEEGEGGGGDISMHEPSEIYIIPLDSHQLDDIFARMCECASLNPDIGVEDDVDDDEGMYYDEEEVHNNITEQHLVSLIEGGAVDDEIKEEEIQQLLRQDPQRFDDPDSNQQQQQQ